MFSSLSTTEVIAWLDEKESMTVKNTSLVCEQQFSVELGFYSLILVMFTGGHVQRLDPTFVSSSLLDQILIWDCS